MNSMSETSRLVILTGGPGSGKTAGLIQRFHHLSEPDQENAVFITVNRSAARELECRFQAESASAIPPVWTLSQVPQEVSRAAGQTGFCILSETDRQRLFAWHLEDSRENSASDRLARWAASRRAVSSDLSAAAGLLQRYEVSPEEFTRFAEQSVNRDVLEALAKLYARYCQDLQESGACDFDGLNARAIQAITAGRVNRIPNYLFVDEAQEMDALQVRLVCAMAADSGKIVAAADPLQRTQMYRGAVPNIRQSLREAMGVEPDIVPCDADSSDGLIGTLAADWRLPKTPACCPKPTMMVSHDPEREMQQIAEVVGRVSGRRAVLTRSNQAAALVRESLRKQGLRVAGIRHASIRAQRFLRDALVLLCGHPSGQGEPDGAYRKTAARLLETNPSASCANGADPIENLQTWLDEAKEQDSLVRRIHTLCGRSQWLQGLPTTERDATARAYSEALRVLAGLESTWRDVAGKPEPLPADEALAEWRDLHNAARYPEAEPPTPVQDMDLEDDFPSDSIVDVLTVHQSAGRHWDHVVLCELQDGGFPQYSTASPFIPEACASEIRRWLESRTSCGVSLGRFERSGAVTLEEERRLFLTALTRARDSVTLSCHVQRADHPVAPSWFFQRLLPGEMALSPVFQGPGRCLLKDTLPESESGVTACSACHVSLCTQRNEDHQRPEGQYRKRADASEASCCPDSGDPALPPGWSFSATALNNYFACPRKFFLGHVLRLVDQEADALEIGAALHRVMEAFNKRTSRTWEALCEEMDKVFEDDTIAKRFTSRAAWHLTQRKIRIALQQYFNRSPVLPGSVEWIEKKIEFHLRDSADHLYAFNGKVDLAVRCDEGWHIVDFKSGQSRKDEKQLRSRMPFVDENQNVEIPDEVDVQLPLYAVGARALDAPPKSVAHEYITIPRPYEGKRLSIPIEPDETPSVKGAAYLTKGDLDAISRFLADIAHQVAHRGFFPPDPVSGECRAFNAPCPFASVCGPEKSRS